MFSNQLKRDVTGDFDRSVCLDIQPKAFDAMLQSFSWLLHDEAKTRFHREISVILNQRRSEIRRQCISHRVHSGLYSSLAVYDDKDHDINDADDSTTCQPHKNETGPVRDWMAGIDLHSEAQSFQYSDYEDFVRKSASSRWLISKAQTYLKLNRSHSEAMDSMSSVNRGLLRAWCSPTLM
ncbi:hypothetical protein Micbo1qcDRAFT_161822, partial [Microdochium bolleyi]